MRVMIALTFSILIFFLYGFYLSQASFDVVPVELKRENPPNYFDYRGALNVSTSLSLGSSNRLDVIDEAKKAGLDFLIVTDLNNFSAPDSLNAYSGSLLVMNESESRLLDSRVLSLNMPKPVDLSQAQLHLTDFLSQNDAQARDGLLILAHPFRDGPTWSGQLPPGLNGIEIVNPKSISHKAWRSSPVEVLWSFIVYPFSPRYAFLRLFREPSEELSVWDQTNLERPLWGFGGADASARAVPLANTLIKFPSYQASFDFVSNHVLLDSELIGHYQKDRAKILNALKRGQFYVSLDFLGNPKGFVAHIRDNDRFYPMGSKLKFKKNLVLQVALSEEPVYFYEIILWRNGEREKIFNSPSFEQALTRPGTYRVQVRVSVPLPIPDGKKWISWIYSNPFLSAIRINCSPNNGTRTGSCLTGQSFARRKGSRIGHFLLDFIPGFDFF